MAYKFPGKLPRPFFSLEGQLLVVSPSTDPQPAETANDNWTERDDKETLLIAEMYFLPYDLLGQHLAPNLEPARDIPREEEQNIPKQCGGGRDIFVGMIVWFSLHKGRPLIKLTPLLTPLTPRNV